MIVCLVKKAITFITYLRETRSGHLVMKTERNKICHANNIIGSMEEKDWMKHEYNLTFNKHVAHKNMHIYVCICRVYIA